MNSGGSAGPEDESRWRRDRERIGSLTCSLVEALAAAKGVEPVELDPIQTVVDADALDRTVASLRESSSRVRDGRVEFTLDGYRVEVTSEGEVAVRRAGEESRGGVTDEAAFEAALSRLVREAARNGVSVEGGWASRDGSEHSDWGIEIYEVDSS